MNDRREVYYGNKYHINEIQIFFKGISCNEILVWMSFYVIFFLLYHERLFINRFIKFPDILSNEDFDQPNLEERK
jgi:hypothetical protein